MTKREENTSVLKEMEKIKNLRGKERLQYIWDYYKLHLAVFCILAYISISIIHGQLVHKETVLFTALVNVTAGETLTEELSNGFLEARQLDNDKYGFYLYSGLYLTDDVNDVSHEYTYASRLKLMAAIDGMQLDVVLMDKEAFDALSQKGWLCDLKELLLQEDPALYKTLEPSLIRNTAVLDGNSSDRHFDESLPCSAKTENYPVGLDLSGSAFIQKAGFQETVYLGIITNSPRKDTAAAYLRYLFQTDSPDPTAAAHF